MIEQFIEAMVRDGTATREQSYFNISMDEHARAKAAIDNPIDYVQEFMILVNTILSKLLGINPEGFSTSLAGRISRKSTYLGQKSIFGRIFNYYGVVEATDRGDLHIHVLCFGSLPGHALSQFVHSDLMRDRIAKILESYYKTYLKRETLIARAVRAALDERKKAGKLAFKLTIDHTPFLLRKERIKPTDGLTLSTLRDRTEEKGASQ